MSDCKQNADKSYADEVLLTKIDEVSERVEGFRARAAYLVEERDAIYLALDAIKHRLYESECDTSAELLEQIEQMELRSKSVTVEIEITRSPAQQDALSEVNELINNMIIGGRNDWAFARRQCTCFLNTCKSDPDGGATDKMFENALLGCALDDQKRIKKRLYGLLGYLANRGTD